VATRTRPPKAPHPDVGVTADPGKFREAIKAFGKRVPMPKAEFGLLDQQAREFAFTVAGAAQADLVAEVYEAIGRAIEEGTTLEDFKAEIGDRLAEAWGGENAPRVETIFRTNVQSAYSEGRYSVFSAPAVKDARPYFRYELIDDGTQSDDDPCLDCDGVVLPQDDQWWSEHLPPLHPNCRCSFTALSEEEARDEGIDTGGPDAEAADGFGGLPSSEGSDWEPDAADYPAAVGDVLENVLK
jgi:SPP1 gp7 family putative phage head morphogenesis protein